jgi:glycosyltransferase involved in cell wall biosynthesis
LEPKRILIIVGKMHYGGIETMIMNYYRNIDRLKIQFDFMLNYEEKGDFDDEIRQLGGKIYILPRLYFKNAFKYIKAVNSFFKEHKEYEIVHGHLTSVGFIYTTIAKWHNVKITILHAHSTAVKPTFKGFLEKIIMFPLRFCADYYFACGNEAGQYAFGKNIVKEKNYKIIKSGILVDNFIFNNDIRVKKREEVNLNDKFVIGHIGRFEYEKNHTFILDIFYEIYKKDKNSLLLLIGKGSGKEAIIEKVSEMNMENAILFLDTRSDINELMQCMDIFLLPSHYEGLPVVGVEAQAAGLQCFFSDAITAETDITGLCHFISLNTTAEFWADEILKLQNGYERNNTKDAIVKAGYDIKQQAKGLGNFYLDN